MRTKELFIPCALVTLCLFTNCMTVLTFKNYQEPFEPVIYGGVRTTLASEQHPHAPMSALIQWAQYIDLPFSLVLDTAALPVTIPLAFVGKSNDLKYARNQNEFVRIIVPEQMNLLVYTKASGNPENAERPFHPGQSSSAVNANNPDYRPIQFPVRFQTKSVPGCYLHCAASNTSTNYFSLGKINGTKRMSVGLIRVPGYYKRNDFFKAVDQQSCIADIAPSSADDVTKSSELAALCNDSFPTCQGGCIATNHPYTLYYVNQEAPGSILLPTKK